VGKGMSLVERYKSEAFRPARGGIDHCITIYGIEALKYTYSTYIIPILQVLVGCQ
jgi:hypothetical protein